MFYIGGITVSNQGEEHRYILVPILSTECITQHVGQRPEVEFLVVTRIFFLVYLQGANVGQRGANGSPFKLVPQFEEAYRPGSYGRHFPLRMLSSIVGVRSKNLNISSGTPSMINLKPVNGEKKISFCTRWMVFDRRQQEFLPQVIAML